MKAGHGSPQLQEILIPGEDWKLVGEGYKFTEGPAANAKGEVFFNDVPRQQDLQDRLDGKPIEFLADTQKRRRAGVRPGRPAVRHRRRHRADRRLRRRGQGDRRRRRLPRQRPRRPARRRHLRHRPGCERHDASKVWFVSPKGEKKVVDTGLKFANGITLSPDQIAALRRRQPHALGLQLPDPAGRLAGAQAEVLPPARARHGRRQRRRRAARRPRRPAVRRDADWACRSATRPAA